MLSIILRSCIIFWNNSIFLTWSRMLSFFSDKKLIMNILFFANISHTYTCHSDNFLVFSARNDRKRLLILVRATTYCFSEKNFLHSQLRALSKIVESISPYRVKVQQTKTKYTSMSHIWVKTQSTCVDFFMNCKRKK